MFGLGLLGVLLWALVVLLKLSSGYLQLFLHPFKTSFINVEHCLLRTFENDFA